MAAAPLVLVDDATPAASLAAAPCVLVIGNFDGVHRGHQAVLQEAVTEARAAGLCACALTFDPHPAQVIGGDAPPLLTSLEHRAELIGALGVDRVYVRHFDAGFAAWEPERFVRDLVVGALLSRRVVVGENFRFGAKRAGDLRLLRALGAECGFEARVHAVARDDVGAYSSTRARDAIAVGNVEEAAGVLGRPHSIEGVVVHGDARGRSLGFPTANLDQIAEATPANGIYAVRVELLRATGTRPLAQGVTSIGVRPTIVDGLRPGWRTVETYLLDFKGDLYGSRIRLHFVSRLRPEKKFDSLQELRAAIESDVAGARAALLKPVRD